MWQMANVLDNPAVDQSNMSRSIKFNNEFNIWERKEFEKNHINVMVTRSLLVLSKSLEYAFGWDLLSPVSLPAYYLLNK